MRGRVERPARDAAAVSSEDKGTSQLPSIVTKPSTLVQIWTGTTTSGESARAGPVSSGMRGCCERAGGASYSSKPELQNELGQRRLRTSWRRLRVYKLAERERTHACSKNSSTTKENENRNTEKEGIRTCNPSGLHRILHAEFLQRNAARVAGD